MKAVLHRFIFFIGIFCFVTACETDDTQTVATFNDLVWEDNFDVDGAPDPQKWAFDIGDGSAEGIPGWGNEELQYYTDRTENVTVQNGFLLITAQEENFNGSSYTSARLKTEGILEQAYGRFEARMRLPFGQGYWPAFWLLGNNCDENPWPACGEIDIMEYVGDEPTVVLGSVHGPGYSGGDAISKDFELENDRFDTGFHVFGIEWTPEYINYYVDDTLYQTLTPEDIAEETDDEGEWIFDRPFYIVLNLAIGGELPGSPNSETIFPQTMLVDYVRVYRNRIVN
ncbi:MAG: glycoside hydrolase family 16 protein [Bacteroidota bacterium]